MKTVKLIGLMLVAFALQLNAQDAKYEKLAAAVRDSVWAWQMPEFQVTSVPDEYKNESAVILAHHTDINASGKVKFNLLSNYGFDQKVYYTSISRRRVKINDKDALDNYSQLSFREKTTEGLWTAKNITNTVVGAKIIKPDGAVKEVDVKDAVTVSESDKSKQQYKKLAIPDLQIGDILDYFFYEEYNLTTENIPTQYFIFGNARYPTLSASLHCEIDDNLTTEYRVINNAPKFDIKKVNKMNYMDAKRTNIPKFGYNIWVAPFRQLPIIRMNILNNKSSMMYKVESARKSGLQTDLTKEMVLTDAFNWLMTISKYYTFNLYREIDKDAVQFKKENPKVSDEEMADYIYRSGILRYSLSGENEFSLAISLSNVLNKFKIENKVGFITQNRGARLDDILEASDLDLIVTANNDKQIFTIPNLLSLPKKPDSDYDGETAALLPVKLKSGIIWGTYRSNATKLMSDVVNVTLPESPSSDNTGLFVSQVNFVPEDITRLSIHRNVELKGDLRSAAIYTLYNLEDIQKERRNDLHIKKDIFEENTKSSAKEFVNDLRSTFKKQREALKDSIASEVEEYYDIKPHEVISYNVASYGVTPSNPLMKYDVKFTLDGLVKKAGNNLIVNAGKLIGSLMKLDDEDRARKIDAYRSFPYERRSEITIAIPEGYSVENTNNLIYNVSNSQGTFTSEAYVQEKSLIIKTVSIYSKRVIPIGEWNKYLDIFDAVSKFNGQSVVLKKL